MYILLSQADAQVQACLSNAQLELIRNILTWAEGPNRDDFDEISEDLHKILRRAEGYRLSSGYLHSEVYTGCA
jgi:hypothetical protein